MPIYEYACDKCQSEFEVEQRITDAPIKSCPRCRSKKVRRLISKTSFVLKGGGWYSDLYASKGAKGDATASAESSGDKAAADDAKPAPKTESASADATPKAKAASAKTASKGRGAKRARR